ncbi:hypothetical protein EDC04DRAFT_818778 [Pisolithus marmoratus]|nr:hypothetical protein EDC04DRAFT_818778 [Pisolithus marmoratus]
MFRALYVLPSSPSGEATKEAPLSITLANSSSGSSTSDSAPDIKLGIRPEDISTTPRRSQLEADVGKLACEYVTMPEEVIDHMLYILREQGDDATGNDGTPADAESSSL